MFAWFNEKFNRMDPGTVAMWAARAEKKAILQEAEKKKEVQVTAIVKMQNSRRSINRGRCW